MIYVDVTGGCVLPLQGGISRVTRQIFRLLHRHRPGSLPVVWQPFRLGYTKLNARALSILEDRFVFPPQRRAPSDTTGSWLAACLHGLALPWPARVPLRRAMQPGDTLFLTSLFPDNRLEYLAALRKNPGRRVALFHDAIPLLDPNVPGWEKKRHRRALALLAQINQVVSVSHASRQTLLALWQEQGLAPAPVAVVELPPSFNQMRPAFLPPPEAANILYIARLKEIKNHATLLAACEKLWRENMVFSVTLIGCEDESKEAARIIRRIRELQEQGRPITWQAQVSEEALHAAYQASTFTAFPSRQEGFGLPIVESFWHGRPVICSDTGAMGEVSRGPGTVHVEIEDVDAWTAVLRDLLKNRARVLDLARAAYARTPRTWDDYWRDLEPHLA